MDNIKNQKIIINNLEKLLYSLESKENEKKREIRKVKLYLFVSKMGMIITPIGIFLANKSLSFSTFFLAEMLFASSYLGSKKIYNDKIDGYNKVLKEVNDVKDTLELEYELLEKLEKTNWKNIKETVNFNFVFDYDNEYDYDYDKEYINDLEKEYTRTRKR